MFLITRLRSGLLRSSVVFSVLTLLVSLVPTIAQLALEASPAAATTPGYVYTVAGNGTNSYSGDGGAATSATLSSPNSVATDSAGNQYIADEGNSRIRKVNAGTGVITTVAGNGTAGYSGDGGAATSAKLYLPYGVAVDSAGNLFIADTFNSRVRKVNAGTGVITTVAGNGTAGYSGDGGAATSAMLHSPTAVAVDSAGNLLIADSWNSRIRKVNAGTGVISTVVGNGTAGFLGDGGAATSAEVNGPAALALDSAGNLFIADQSNHRIRKVNGATGVISTVAGSNSACSFGGDGGLATSARLCNPTGIAVDSAGNLFIDDRGNYEYRTVKASTGIITAFAGTGASGYSGDGGPATSAKVSSGGGIAVDSSGNVYLADTNNMRIRKVVGIAATGPLGGVFTGPETFGNSNPGEPCPQVQRCSGDPVNTSDGNFWESFDDISIPGRGPAIDSQRTYNSLAASNDSAFGYGWSFTYGVSLSIASGVATVTQENGSTITFNQSGSTFTPTASRVQAALVQNVGGTYTLTRQKRQIFNFDSSGNLTSIKDLNGYTTTLTRSSGTLTVTDPASRTLTYTYTGSHITGLTDPAGRTMSFSYDGSGNLTDVIDVGSGHAQFSYDSSHRLLTMRSPKYYGDTTTTPSPVTTNHYDSSGRVDWQSDPLGRTTYFDYTSVAGSTKVTDPKSNVVLYTYLGGEVVSETHGYGTSAAATWSYYYDPATAALTSVTDPNGHVTQAYYDANGNKVLAIDALGHITAATYDSLNDPLTVTDPLGYTTTYTYDSAGDLLTKTEVLTSVTPHENEVTTWNYDPSHVGDVTSISDPLSHSTTFTHDATTGDVTAVTDAAGNKTTYSYNSPTSIGWVMSSVSPDGNVSGGTPANFTTTYVRDNFGRATTTKDPMWSSSTPTAHESQMAYDANGNVTSTTDGDNNTTTYSYDAANELLSTTRPDSTTLSNSYNADGTLYTQTDGASHSTTYGYDTLGRVTSVTDPDSHSTTYVYDGAGNTLNKIDPSGTCTGTPSGCTTYTYDAANELKTIGYSDGTTHGITYNYDADGQRSSMVDGTGTTSYSYDSLHRLTSSTNGAGATVGYTYDRANRQTQISYPGSYNVTQAYDNANRLTSVTDWNSHATSFSYDANGNLGTITYPNGVTASNTFDDSDAMSATSDTTSSTTLASFSYTRDGASLLSSVTSTGVGSNETYGLNSLEQLTSVNSNSYGYDSADNPTTLPGSTQSFDAANELSSSTAGGVTTNYTYDSRGNRTATTPTGGTATSYSYDQANRLTSVSGAASGSYTYDGDGLRASKTVSGTTQQMTWDNTAGTPLLLSDGTNSYIYGPGGIPVEQVASNHTTTYYLHQDQLGSTRLVTDSSGNNVASYTYDAFGNTTSKTGSVSTPLQYAGQYTDAETGIQYLRARYYDPATAQFLSRDPLVSTTRSAYGYVDNSPLNGSDPTGLVPEDMGAAMGQSLKTWVKHTTLNALASVGRGFYNLGSGLTNTASFGLISDSSADSCSTAYQIGAWGAVLIPGEGEEAVAAKAITKAESPIWKAFKAFRQGTKTNGASGSARRYYEWDHTHNDIEVYDKTGTHLGSMDPVTGDMTKPQVPGRTMNQKP